MMESMTEDDLAKIEEWMLKAKRPVLLMHPEDAKAGGQPLLERLEAAMVKLKTSPAMERGKLFLMDEPPSSFASYNPNADLERAMRTREMFLPPAAPVQ